MSLLIFSFAACGSEKNILQGSGEESTGTSVKESSGKDDFSHEEDISDAQQTLGSEGGDLHLIETVTPYTADFDELRDVNHDEMGRNYLPELKESNLDIAGYEMVFVGYPVWATDVPQAHRSRIRQKVKPLFKSQLAILH